MKGGILIHHFSYHRPPMRLKFFFRQTKMSNKHDDIITWC